jgi:hypothetical protein
MILQKDAPKPLGRWKIETCNTKINGKIDLSNEDHCGPCGEYALEKKESKNNKPDFKLEITKTIENKNK